MTVARDHNRFRLQVDRDDIQRRRYFAPAHSTQVIVRSTGHSAVPNSISEKGERFANDDIADRLGSPAAALSICQHQRQSPLGTFDHLQRIADDQYKPGRKKWEATRQFVDVWFDDVLGGVYGGNLRKLLGDEKLIRSAFLFYVREQIPRKRKDVATAQPETPEA